jgi:DNA replication protein DnaC
MIEQTKSQMNELKLHGALQTIDQRLHDATAHGWGHLELLSSLMTDEKLYRDTQAISRRVKAASFRTTATMERLDLTAKRTLTKTMVRDLMSLSFLKSGQRNVLITGPTGIGKTYLATAIGEYACRSGFTCIFVGVHVLMERLMMTRADGTYLKYRERLIKADLLIIDDVGLKKLPPEIAIDLHDLLEERQNKSTLITTQLPLKNWREIIEDPLALDSVVDKLENGTLHVKIDGPTMRKMNKDQVKIDSQCVPEEITVQ